MNKDNSNISLTPLSLYSEMVQLKKPRTNQYDSSQLQAFGTGLLILEHYYKQGITLQELDAHWKQQVSETIGNVVGLSFKTIYNDYRKRSKITSKEDESCWSYVANENGEYQGMRFKGQLCIPVDELPGELQHALNTLPPDTHSRNAMLQHAINNFKQRGLSCSSFYLKCLVYPSFCQEEINNLKEPATLDMPVPQPLQSPPIQHQELSESDKNRLFQIQMKKVEALDNALTDTQVAEDKIIIAVLAGEESRNKINETKYHLLNRMEEDITGESKTNDLDDLDIFSPMKDRMGALAESMKKISVAESMKKISAVPHRPEADLPQESHVGSPQRNTRSSPPVPIQSNNEASGSSASLATTYWKGLPNLGNTCYMNVIVQSLKTLGGFEFEGLCGSVAMELRTILTLLSSPDATTPAVARSAAEAFAGAMIRAFGFKPGEQNDTNEFLVLLCDKIREDNLPSHLQHLRPSDDQATQKQNRRKDIQSMSLPASIMPTNAISLFYEVTLAATTACSKSRLDQASFLDLHMNEGPNSIPDMLQHWCAPCHVDNSECNCGAISHHKKHQIVLWSPHLNLQISRYIHGAKNRSPVDIPNELQVADSPVYKLETVITHQGHSLFDGHYFVDTVRDNEAFSFNDDNVSKSNCQLVGNCDAYTVIYRTTEERYQGLRLATLQATIDKQFMMVNIYMDPNCPSKSFFSKDEQVCNFVQTEIGFWQGERDSQEGKDLVRKLQLALEIDHFPCLVIFHPHSGQLVDHSRRWNQSNPTPEVFINTVKNICYKPPCEEAAGGASEASGIMGGEVMDCDDL